MNATWLGGRATVNTPPATGWFTQGPASEAEHQAALAEIDLPPHPLGLHLSPWQALRQWLAETAQLAIGFLIGALAVVMLLSWLAR